MGGSFGGSGELTLSLEGRGGRLALSLEGRGGEN